MEWWAILLMVVGGVALALAAFAALFLYDLATNKLYK